ncbi:hypothetical protein [Clostridium perfringens]|uniref:hypothetical protein n=1 Tax=Clostridium perfringens TaxID=1502 RepID=UPI001C85D0DA|nr:hypothetical protein [Clostridium perfringens]
MDILYYFNHTEDQIQALNLDNIKHMKYRWFCDSEEVNYQIAFNNIDKYIYTKE